MQKSLSFFVKSSRKKIDFGLIDDQGLKNIHEFIMNFKDVPQFGDCREFTSSV